MNPSSERFSSSRRKFVELATLLPALSASAAVNTGAATTNDRDYWRGALIRIAHPVLDSLSRRKLRASMPVEAPQNTVEDRRQYTYLEAFGRTLSGVAPWLESGESSGTEGELRRKYTELARQSIAAAVDPASPDYMNFDRGSQPVVDAAFLALAILRAPSVLWRGLDPAAQRNLVKAMLSTRVIRPGFNNWLLFSATIEAFLALAGEQWDPMRVDYAVRQHGEWYKGDGVYGDGPQFHWDYYNSFVIQPMLLQVLDTVSDHSDAWKSFRTPVLARAQRYAVIQERLISPEGTFPVIGRSMAYRFGAFHHLADISLRRQLPESLPPEQVRSALTAVIRRVIEQPRTFDSNGWLTVGVCGHQPGIAESYISTGSLYLCATAFLPLGLPAADPFWSKRSRDWTAKRIWAGEDIRADHALTGAI
jgi:hypothetical protein